MEDMAYDKIKEFYFDSEQRSLKELESLVSFDKRYIRNLVDYNRSLWVRGYKNKDSISYVRERLTLFCETLRFVGLSNGDLDVNCRLGPDYNLLPFFLLNRSWALDYFLNIPLHEKYQEVYLTKKVEPSIALFLQCILKENWTLAEELASKQRRHRSNILEGDFYRIIDYLNVQDKDGLFKELNSICAADEKKPFANYMEWFQNLFSCRGTSLLRVLRHIGYDISIDHPLIPMDLMSSEEEEYEVPYFFLEGYKGDLPDNYKRWLVEQGDARDSKKHIQNRGAVSSQKKLWDADKYRSETEQWSVEQFRKAGYKVTGNKEDGWEIYEEE